MLSTGLKKMLRELDLTEEELLIINKNEKNAKINIFQNEKKKALLTFYAYFLRLGS